jgi:hypothetical protein
VRGQLHVLATLFLGKGPQVLGEEEGDWMSHRDSMVITLKKIMYRKPMVNTVLPRLVLII